MRLTIPTTLFNEMQAHVQQCVPEEACGLLAGTTTENEVRIKAVLPVENALHSPVRFRMEPYAQLAALNWIEARGYLLAGIFHSHPNGPPHPSATDLAEAFYPEAAYLIWYRPSSGGSLEERMLNDPMMPQRPSIQDDSRVWTCRAYRVSASGFEGVKYHLLTDEQL
jgi:proteasome lid subunit RPN8/RPN11